MSDNIQIINGTGHGIGTRVILNGKELEGVISISYNSSVGAIAKVSLEMYVDSVDLTTEAELLINKKKKVNNNKKFTRFEIMDI